MNEKVWVLCLNDFPIGVYSSKELAHDAQIADAGQQRHVSRPMMMHYHIHDFVLLVDLCLECDGTQR